MSDQEFGDLIARARQGDSAAMERLIRAYEPEIRRAARWRLGPALRSFVDSMDVVQSVHRTLLRNLQQGRFDIPGPKNLIALALKLVERKIARYWGQQQRERELLEKLKDFLAGRAQGDFTKVIALEDALRAVVSKRDDIDKRLLELHLEGRGTVEIAGLMGLNADFLRVRLARMRERLRDAGVSLD
jgi:RNA polymerase sigma factor (sigma-70 family)